MAMPAGSRVEIEFVPGVWTDVTADADDPSGFTIKRGRTSEFSAPSVGTIDGLRLNNTTGKYTPASQVLVDGSPHPYWPNVLPRKRIRYSNTPAGVRGTAYIKGWPPFVDINGTAWVMLSSTDRLDQLSRVTLKSPIAQEQQISDPVLSWPLTEPADSKTAVEAGGGPSLSIVGGAGAPLLFGDVGPGAGDGTGVKFAPSSASSGQYLSAALPATTFDAFSFEVYVNAGMLLPAWALGGGGGSTESILGLEGPGGSFNGLLYLFDGQPSYQDYLCVVNGGVSIVDGGWHHLVVTRAAAAAPVTLWVDGVSQGDNVAGSTISNVVGQVTVGESASPNSYVPNRFQGSIGRVGLYDRVLSPAEILAHARATTGYSGDRTDQRIARWLTHAGLTSAEWSLDVGKCVVGTYPQAGKSVVAACQDMATSEGGGASFYDSAGVARFTNRNNRKPGAPVMILDAVADLDGNSYAPSFDELNLVNQVTVTRSGTSGVLSTQTAQDLASQAAYNLSSGTVDTYTLSDADALALAQSQVAAQAWPGFRLTQVAVDLLTAQTPGLYAALAAIQIGSRIRVGNLPRGLAPSTQVDLIVEGWPETIAPDVYRVVFDTSPADNPARAVYDDPTYGRYQCSGQSLNAPLTNAATTVVIATTAGLPTFTTVAARYPLAVTVGAEVITLTTAPSGAASPQTFTGAVRGAAGTSPAAQASASTVQLFPAATYTL